MAQYVQPRRVRGSRSIFRLATAVAVAAVMLVGVGRLNDLLPSLSNPFATDSVDRSAPAVLHALEDVAEYRAAVGNYSVLVDVEKDTRFVPSFLKGERTVFSAVGSVDATVDFGTLDESTVTIVDGTVTIRLPAAELGEATVSPTRSRVVARDRGALDRLGSVFSDSPTSEQRLYALALTKLDAAAAADDTLVRQAERNTARMIDNLLTPLGFTEVKVVFAA